MTKSSLYLIDPCVLEDVHVLLGNFALRSGGQDSGGVDDLDIRELCYERGKFWIQAFGINPGGNLITKSLSIKHDNWMLRVM